MSHSGFESEDGYVIVYRRWITTRSGRRIYPRRGKAFRLKIRASKAE